MTTHKPLGTITIAPATILIGAAAKLTWTSTYATIARINGQKVPLQGSMSISPRESASYNLVLFGPGGIFEATAKLTVQQHVAPPPVPPPPPPSPPSPPTGSFAASPSTIIPPGTSELTWTSSGATSAVINNGVGNVFPVAGGSVSVDPSVTTTYQLTLTGPGGSYRLTQTVRVNAAAPTGTFDADPATIAPSAPTELQWTSENATSASIDNGVGSVTPVAAGEVPVSPSETTTYHITFDGPGGSISYPATVTVSAAPTGTFVADPTTIAPSGTSELEWTSTNATSASIDNGVGSVTPVAGGEVAVSPLVTTTYELTLSGPGGSQMYPATVTVTGSPAPTGTFVADPSTITDGGTAELVWTSSNATSAAIDNGIGSVSPAAGGSTPVTPGSTTTYNITFTGPGGSISYPATVEVEEAGSVLATITVVNTSSSIVPANMIPPTRGIPFKQGDIPSGTWPQLKLTSGTVCTANFDRPLYWPDDSMKHAVATFQLPTEVAASGSVAVNVCSGGTAPAVSTRTTADFTSQNIQTQLDGLDNLTGTWTAFLNHGVTNTNQSFGGQTPIVYDNGPVAKTWWARSSFEQGGAPHGQLESEWIVMAMTDVDGNLYGLRVMPWADQPWYDNDTPAKTFRSFTGVRLQNGSTVLRDQMAGFQGPAQAQTFSWPGSGNVFTVGSTALFTEMCALRLSTTGSLYVGLETNQTYFAHIVDGTHVQLTLTQGTAELITPTGAGSGTQTMTAYPYLSHFGAESFTDTTGDYNYIQAGGSVAAEAPLRIEIDKVYWEKSLVFPPLDLTITPTSNTPKPRYWNNVAPLTAFVGETGERGDIGALNQFSATHFLTQAAPDETIVICNGLIGMTFPYWMRDTTTKSIPVCNANTYAGMPAGNENFYWQPGNGTPFTTPNPACLAQAWSGEDFSHLSELVGYAYLHTGAPHLMLANIMWANQTVMNSYPGPGTAVVNGTTNDIGGIRNATINGTVRTGMITGGQTRYTGWALRNLAIAKAIAPACPENASYSLVINDYYDASIGGWNDFTTMNTAYWKTNGLWATPYGTDLDPWELGYVVMGASWAYALTGDGPTLTFLNHIVSWFDHVYEAIGGWHISNYETLTRPSATSNGAIITSDNQFGLGGLTTLSWAPGTSFTCTGTGSNYTPTVGDIYNWDPNQAMPAGTTLATPYWIVDLVGSGVGATFGVSLTKGGSPITLTDSGSGVQPFLQWSNAGATGAASGNNGYDGYLTNTLFSAKWAIAVGATINSARITDQQTRWSSYGGTIPSVFAANPKYGFQEVPGAG